MKWCILVHFSGKGGCSDGDVSPVPLSKFTTLTTNTREHDDDDDDDDDSYICTV